MTSAGRKSLTTVGLEVDGGGGGALPLRAFFFRLEAARRGGLTGFSTRRGRNVFAAERVAIDIGAEWIRGHDVFRTCCCC